MAESKIRIKFGNIEIEHEGTEAFIKTELPELVKAFIAILNDSVADGSILNAPTPIIAPIAIQQAAGGTINLTTNNIAVKLGCKNATDLIISACAHLHFVKGKNLFTRDEILTEMKTAPSFFDENGRKNLTQNLKSLLRADKLNEPGTDKYAFTNSTIIDLQSKLV